jgi:hypothetical protein
MGGIRLELFCTTDGKNATKKGKAGGIGGFPSSKLSYYTSDGIARGIVQMSTPAPWIFDGEHAERDVSMRSTWLVAEAAHGSNQEAKPFEIMVPLSAQISADVALAPKESYSGSWNAHSKDKLENKLHSLVCVNQVDLKTAQREIATDWIAAYKKYVGE